MNRPRIFINMHYLELGGAERALIGLLNALDTNKVEVDLFLNQHTGAFMPLIPEKINLIKQIPAYSAIERPLKDILLEGHLGIFCGRLLGKWRLKRYLKSVGLAKDASHTQYAFDGVIPFLPSLKHLGHYDMAISFLDPPHIVQDKVDASIKMEWIHTDWSAHQVNKELVAPRWGRNDYIVSISEAVTQQFLKAFPQFGNKIIEIGNILSPTFVRHQAEKREGMDEFASDGLTICSVGRISYVKNFDNIPHIAKYLKAKGLKFHWYIVGPGDYTAIEKVADNNDVRDNIHFVGAKPNPYPWMKACDIYVQPSRLEGNSVTVREAQILGKLVIVTDYPTAKSQIQNGVDGIICPMDNEGIANAIFALAKDKHLQETLSTYVSTHDYGNETEVEKIYQLLNID